MRRLSKAKTILLKLYVRLVTQSITSFCGIEFAPDNIYGKFVPHAYLSNRGWNEKITSPNILKFTSNPRLESIVRRSSILRFPAPRPIPNIVASTKSTPSSIAVSVFISPSCRLL